MSFLLPAQDASYEASCQVPRVGTIVKGLATTTRQRGKGGVAGAPRAPSAEKRKEDEGVFIVFGHRVTASYLYSQPLSITPW
jgi:hypothetical protein